MELKVAHKKEEDNFPDSLANVSLSTGVGRPKRASGITIGSACVADGLLPIDLGKMASLGYPVTALAPTAGAVSTV